MTVVRGRIAAGRALLLHYGEEPLEVEDLEARRPERRSLWLSARVQRGLLVVVLVPRRRFVLDSNWLDLTEDPLVEEA